METKLPPHWGAGENFDFSGMTLENIDFTGANLKGAKFNGAKIINCKFDNANLENAQFNDLQRVIEEDEDEKKPIISGVFSKLALSASFKGANLTNAQFHSTAADARDAIVNVYDFSKATVCGTDFSGTDLRHSTFAGVTDFTDTDLTGCRGVVITAPDSETQLILRNTKLKNAALLGWRGDEIFGYREGRDAEFVHSQIANADATNADLRVNGFLGDGQKFYGGPPFKGIIDGASILESEIPFFRRAESCQNVRVFHDLNHEKELTDLWVDKSNPDRHKFRRKKLESKSDEGQKNWGELLREKFTGKGWGKEH